MTFGMIQAISETQRKKGRISSKVRENGYFMTLYSDIRGETEKSGTVMDTQTFIRDDHPSQQYKITQLFTVHTKPVLLLIPNCVVGIELAMIQFNHENEG